MVLRGLLRLRLNLLPHDVSLLCASASIVQERLFVTLRGNWSPLSLEQVQQKLQFVYQSVAQVQPELDVRVLLPCNESDIAPGVPEIDSLLGDTSDEDELESVNARRAALGLPLLSFVAVPSTSLSSSARIPTIDVDSESAPAALYAHVCLGGTFDYMHVGHKLLLSLGAYSASQRLVCGVSDAPLLKKKTLRELMQPVDLRMALVDDFLHSIKPSLTYEVAALQDGFGPAVTDRALEAIVVSEETKKGGEMCNEKRSQASMAPLAVVVMPLVDEGVAEHGAAVGEENKVSSTDKRRALLGRLRGGGEAHWRRHSASDMPYVIGLTGGIASGKSTARRLLMEMSAARDWDGAGHGSQATGTVVELDCDRLAHEAYAPGTPAYSKLIEAFGENIVSRSPETHGAIDRQALGAIVFADPAKMQELNQIVWPATSQLAKARIEESGARIVVMEAAVLLEAGWDDFVDEVWVVTAPHASILSRLAERNGLSEEAAEARVASQLGATERVARCHVPLSSAFGEEGLREQLALALTGAARRASRDLSAAPAASPAGAFRELCTDAGVPEGAQRLWWHRLRDAYCSVDRRYHTMEHVADMQARVTSLVERGQLRSPLKVGFAVFFHDAVYDATKKDNEARSADLWRDFAACMPSSSPLVAVDVDLVAKYIERTAHHLDGPATGDLALFLDCDLQVLARPPAEYAEYARQVRLEYAHYPSAAFCKGRAEVLRGFSTAPNLFFALAAELDAPARRNLEAEIQWLERRGRLLSS
jgi:phosphopantetheine adenylyltransferase/dephospho-CoA kinase